MIIVLENQASGLASRLFITYLCMFLIGDLLGYLLEVFFRRFITAKKWVNPGFMKGPWLPLYGFGLCILFTFSVLLKDWLPSSWAFYNPVGDNPTGASVYDLVVIIILTCSLILLEFIAGIIFVKGFKVRLWDYSNMKGNILGVICPLFSFFWFVISLVYYYCLNPLVTMMFKSLFEYLFQDTGMTAHFIFIFFLGVVYGIMLIDFIHSIGIFSKITAYAKKTGLLVRYEKFREEQKKNLQESKKKFLALLPNKVTSNDNKTAEKPKQILSKVDILARKLFLINPDLKKEDNYDSSNRPKSDK